MKENGWKMIFTVIVAILGGWLFTVLSIPVPWLLGPIAVLLLGSSVKRSLFYWPKKIKSVGMVIIGYTIGLALTGDAIKAIGHQLPYMLSMTTLLILLSAAVAYIVSKLSNTNYPTALLASIPGGMTQIILMAEEMKGVNLTIVTVTQTIRLMLIVIGMPLILAVLGQNSNANEITQATETGFNLSTAFVFILCILFSFIGKKIKFPTAFLLVPALVTAIMQGTNMNLMDLPTNTLQFAQLLIGINIGLMMKPGELENKTRTLSLAIFSGILIFITAMLLGLFFAKINNFDLPTALLSLAPGGMDQMGAIAHAIHADLSMVAGYQVFRAFFILFIIQPVLVYYLQKKGLISR